MAATAGFPMGSEGARELLTNCLAQLESYGSSSEVTISPPAFAGMGLQPILAYLSGMGGAGRLMSQQTEQREADPCVCP